MRINLLKGIYILACVCLMFNCKKQNLNPGSNSNDLQASLKADTQGEGAIELGKQLPNPYDIDIMKKAYESIKDQFPHAQSPVRLTHNYTKLNVQDEQQLSDLKKDSTIVIYPYPLDFEITTAGTYYRHEEGQCDSCVTAQFASLKDGQQLPANIETEILAKLYIPEEDADLDLYVGKAEAEAFEEAILTEAFNMVGLNIDDNPGNTGPQKRVAGSKWRPAGKIRVWDDITNNYVGVEGVEVKARRWFTTHKGFTNSNGDYSCDGEFRHDANYSLQWERKHFSIRSGTYGQATYDGPKQRGNWNLDLNSGSHMFYARIFRAAHQYYYHNIDGLNRPPLNNSLFDPQLKIAAYNQVNTTINGNAAPWRRFLGLGNFIKLYNPQNKINAIHGTTIHELTHASHWNMCSPKSNYNNSDEIVAESWARGVQWWLTRKYYPGYQPPYTFGSYTGVVEDMIDGVGGYDQVQGYTIAQIEQAVKNKKTWAAWRDNVINLYANASEGNVPALYNYWD
jgi:hypothetical protein